MWSRRFLRSSPHRRPILYSPRLSLYPLKFFRLTTLVEWTTTKFLSGNKNEKDQIIVKPLSHMIAFSVYSRRDLHRSPRSCQERGTVITVLFGIEDISSQSCIFNLALSVSDICGTCGCVLRASTECPFELQ